MRRFVLLFLLLILSQSCIKEPDNSFTNNNLNSALWMQTAAEYQANTIQIYQVAVALLDGLIADKNHTALPEQIENYQQLPPAIILDIDETVLDNMPYDAKLILENRHYSSDDWNQWVSLEQATAVPGAVEFLNNAQEKGVAIFYISNRKCAPEEGSDNPCPQEEQTFKNLQNIGINNVSMENILLQNKQESWVKDKTSRRTFVAQKYRVIMLFGDNLADFVSDTAKTQKQRESLVLKYSEKWGTCWFMLANPVYGNWQGVLAKPIESNLKIY